MWKIQKEWNNNNKIIIITEIVVFVLKQLKTSWSGLKWNITRDKNFYLGNYLPKWMDDDDDWRLGWSNKLIVKRNKKWREKNEKKKDRMKTKM